MSIKGTLSLILLLTGLATAAVRPGIEVLLADSLHLVQGLQLGLVTNQTGIDSKGRSTILLLSEHPDLHLVRLFAPEHGLDGSRGAGEIIRSETHERTGLLVTSLYHGKRSIDPGLLQGLDAILFDIQDVGVRPYTYVSTMAEVMKAAGQAAVPVIVLDRPNPLGGDLVSGLVLDPDWASFIGPYPVPYVHGMTVAELALLFQGEFGVECSLRVIPAAGWKRNQTFDKTGLPWVPTSPHVPTWQTAWGLAALGAVGELGTVSEGVGSTMPFFLLGGPGLDSYELQRELASCLSEEVLLLPWTWIPYYGKWKGQVCQGVRLEPRLDTMPDPAAVQVCVLASLRRQMGEELFVAASDRLLMFDRAMGSDEARMLLQAGGSGELLEQRIEKDCTTFRKQRSKYLLYREES